MEFRVLGRLRVAEGSAELTPTRPRERAVIAALLLRRGRSISTGEVVDGVWGEAAPPTARTALHGLISSLRRRLGSARIVTVSDGYRLDLGEGDAVDADRVAALAAKASATTPTARSELLREAVELFQGEPFERLELADGSALAAELAAESARLTELRIVLEEQRAAADLELGRHEDVVPRLDRLVEEHPLRESLRTQLMLALYRSGRQADALRVAQDTRRVLAEELGVEPGPALQRLERMVLEQDPTLAASLSGRALPAQSRTAAGLVTFLATDAPASVSASVAAGHDGAAESEVRGWTVLRFERAREAATAAALIIRASRGRTGAGDQPSRVGLHSANIDLARGSLPGPEVDRARQLARVAHMGQALLSRATRDLLREAPMALADIIELGDHRLADLRPPQPVYQLVAPGLGVDFPPVLGLEARRTNLPFLESPLIGREQDLDELTQIMRTGDSRLVTLTGPGGTGKTRLALHAAAELVEDAPGGIFFVALDGLSDPQLVGAAIASAVGIPAAGLAEVGITDELGDRPAILVLDNFEHLLAATPVVAAILGATPVVRILATSRTALGLPSERVYPVSSLAEGAGVALFTARARTASRAFSLTQENSDAVGALVRALDGLPLAIELAGSRMSIVPPAAVLERIQGSLRVLDAGRRPGPPRHRALEATIDWSHDLLESDRQRLFADLAVFAGGWTLDAAERVCDPGLNVIDGLASLSDDSLVRVGGDPEAPRFRMLDTIREYASGKLTTTGRRSEVERRHADFYLGLAEAAVPHLRGNPGQWLGLLAAERDNVRAALDRLGAGGDHAAVANLSGALWRFWYLAGDLDEGRQRLEAALASHPEQDAARARALIGAAVMAVNLKDPAHATDRATEALQLHETLGDAWGAAYARFMLAAAARAFADLTRARELDEAAHAAFRALGDEHTALLVSRHLANILEDLGDGDAARDRHHDNLRRAREQGNGRLEASTLGALATIAFDEGRVADARWMLRESLGLHRELRDRLDTAVDLARAARTLSMSGEAEVAGHITAALGRIDHELGARRGSVQALLDDASARVGRQLSSAELAEAQREGSRLTLDAAVQLALDALG
jgi:predicted ATPase/DNA-binding SARP family transcriptional activator